jgi:hypothetical protein
MRRVQGQKDWGTLGASLLSLLAWVLANVLDVLSVLALVRGGGRMVFALATAAAAWWRFYR